ncbi:hypothetical protein MXEN_05625 [Mycobacterium xenopi RIVM700367]|uniref:MinD/ParA family ATP-binding protein n=1 Tax=Mycobacterium xenopi TaxID=1789 RepID=UPI00025AD641|nr:MinD/ParA family protein [Mycobacterium xenopi]EID15930.1 hypothetical protein MXEN_05625 [Mycobacterium xenopi RIVM700367]
MTERDDFLMERLRSGPVDRRATHPPQPEHKDQQTMPLPAYPPGRPRPTVTPAQPRPAGVAHHPAPTPRPAAPGPVAAPVRPRPSRGWRHLVLVATRGLVNLGPSAHERQEARFEAAVQAVLRGNYKVGVLGKGGVGKTTVAASVGSIFAELRRQDRVVAVDADTAFGRLASRIDPRTESSYWELAADKNLRSFADVRARVGTNAAGLYVLAGDPPAGRRRVLDPAIYREAALRLDRHFTISVVDCGSTMDAPVTQEALRDLDALIVVSSPWADGASAAAQTMEWLAEHGRTGLLRRSVVVLNDSDGHADKRTRAVLTRQFVDRGQKVVEVPFDPHLRPGGVIDVRREMGPATRRRFLEIAATVAEYFASRPDGARDRIPT